jgi:hypothetical protein
MIVYYLYKKRVDFTGKRERKEYQNISGKESKEKKEVPH